MYSVVKWMRGFSDRLVAGLIGTFLVLVGVTGLVSDGLFWMNYWGGLVFIPFVVVGGLLLLAIAAFAPASFSRALRMRESSGGKGRKRTAGTVRRRSSTK